jgi:hypothetical protein
MKKIMRFKKKSSDLRKSYQLPGAGRTRAWHHHRSDMPTSPIRAIYVLKSAKGRNIFWGVYICYLLSNTLFIGKMA